MTDGFDFSDLTPQEVPVKGLFGQDWVLAEASAAAVATYDNRKMAGAVLSEDGTVARLSNLADLRALAVALCLYPADWDRATERAPDAQAEFEARVRRWPDRVIDPLYNRLTEISPTLLGKQSVEDLLEQRARLDRAIRRLEARGGFDPKGRPADSTDSSPTAGS